MAVCMAGGPATIKGVSSAVVLVALVALAAVAASAAGATLAVKTELTTART